MNGWLFLFPYASILGIWYQNPTIAFHLALIGFGVCLLAFFAALIRSVR